MNGHWENKLIMLPVEPIEVIHPELLYIAGIDPSVTVSALLDEHHLTT